ncbi:MAG: phosphonate ABC transporter ATP-binding protein [Treponema sp.]|nr:phosphonate ABC transporter ATP-binding protein [Treponema sp.]
MAILEISGLTKIYKSTIKALDSVSFSVKKGEFVSIIGPSGAGKSTLIRCINRLVDATEGTILVADEDVTKMNSTELRRLRTKIGMIFQNYNLVEKRLVIDNVLHGRLGYKNTLAGMFGRYTREEHAEALKILKQLGLKQYAYNRCDELSGGQKQRVGIARALIQNPKIFLADEPIASLDPASAKLIMDELMNMNKKTGITCLLNLHQVQTAKDYSDRIIGINNGRIVFDGKPKQLNDKIIAEIYNTPLQNE